MDIDQCANKIYGFEKSRQAFFVSVVKLIRLIPVERAEVQPLLNELKDHNACCKELAVQFFHGNNATLNYLQNFDNWWEANRNFIKYIKHLFPEINRRYPGWIADKILNIDLDEVLNQEIYYRN